MCERAVCSKCGKATYQGCGMHVEQVLADVPMPQRCTCDQAQDRPRRGLWAVLRRR